MASGFDASIIAFTVHSRRLLFVISTMYRSVYAMLGDDEGLMGTDGVKNVRRPECHTKNAWPIASALKKFHLSLFIATTPGVRLSFYA
jgi:hypothetical protein